MLPANATLDETEQWLAEAGAKPRELVAGKGYHLNATMTVPKRGLRSNAYRVGLVLGRSHSMKKRQPIQAAATWLRASGV